MVVETIGYLQLVEHLSFNLDVFGSGGGADGAKGVGEVVADALTNTVRVPLQQNAALPASVRAELLREVDAVLVDLSEVLVEFWERPSTDDQVRFLDEMLSLIGNLFESAASKYS